MLAREFFWQCPSNVWGGAPSNRGRGDSEMKSLNSETRSPTQCRHQIVDRIAWKVKAPPGHSARRLSTEMGSVERQKGAGNRDSAPGTSGAQSPSTHGSQQDGAPGTEGIQAPPSSIPRLRVATLLACGPEWTSDTSLKVVVTGETWLESTQR